MILKCFVVAWVGAVAQATPLGGQPQEFVSRATGVRMSYPKDWTVTVDDTHRAPKDADGDDYYTGLLFEAVSPAGNDGLKITLRKDDQNAPLLKLWGGKDDPWKNTKLPHNLPTEFQFRKHAHYFTTVNGRRVSVSFSMYEDDTSIATRFIDVLATGLDAKGRCFSLQGSLWQFESVKAPTTDAEKVMKREYPIFVAMLKSLSFENQ